MMKKLSQRWGEGPQGNGRHPDLECPERSCALPPRPQARHPTWLTAQSAPGRAGWL